MNYTKNILHSDFWLGADARTKGVDLDNDLVKAHRLGKQKRAIGNFVQILTGDSIPVEFHNTGDSYTDGKKVTISSDLESTNTDETVGIAMHEASHIKMTDFKLLPKLVRTPASFIPKKLQTLADTKKVTLTTLASVLKDLLNVVEDRRIDNYVYTTSPGYRSYYNSMYNKYFWSSTVSELLSGPKLRELDLNSYMARIINIINPSHDSSALPGLDKITDILDIQNIGRLKNTKDALAVAYDICEVILENIEIPQYDDQKSDDSGESDQSSDSNESGGESDSSSEQESGDDSDESENGSGSDSDEEGDESGESDSGSGSDSDEDGDQSDSNSNSDSGNPSQSENTYDSPSEMSDLSDMDKEILGKIQDFLDGNVEKEEISQEMADKLKTVDDNDVDVKEAGTSSFNKTDVIVYNKLTESVMALPEFEIGSKYEYGKDAVDAGVTLGKMLGRKLKIRTEERAIRYNRKNSGKLDKRMIASAGFGFESIFEQTYVEKFQNAVVHISIDGSSSMHGEKWNKAITNAVAIAKAADMVGNMDVSISVRATQRSSGYHIPMVAMVYDSKKDAFTKVLKYFPRLQSNGYTPEGLCFEAMSKMLTSADYTTDSYFINLSDGEPYYSGNGMSYQGRTANQHTRNEIKKLEKRGLKILSYFVGHSTYRDSNFIECYGEKNCAFIDVNNVNEISRTVNKMMLDK